MGQVMISPSANSLRFSIGVTPFQSFELLGAPTLIGCGSYCATVLLDFQKYATAGAVPAIEVLRPSRGLPLPSGVGCSYALLAKKRGIRSHAMGKRIPLKKAKKRGLPRFLALAVF